MSGYMWMSTAACAGQSTFTEQLPQTQMATCSGCPVRGECLDYGLGSPVYNTCEAVPYGGFSPRGFTALCVKRSAVAHRSAAIQRSLTEAIDASLAGVA